ncbi:MAG: tetratricopeptide repeat protein [Prolixibacteraceae bacterium]|jgi:TolA-binding protein|nr:tetratricopeptide repeat protein [Prolixibacteraceae bacterium]
MKTIGLLLIITFFHLSSPVLHAQQTTYYGSTDQEIETAKELFRKNNFASALQKFGQIIGKTDESSELHSEACYFQALCALKMDNENAEPLISGFIGQFPTSPYKNQAWFELGSNQFEHKKYAVALRSFREVNTAPLATDDRVKLHYRKGYSYFAMEKYDEAATEFFGIKDVNNMYAAPARYYWAHIHYLKENYQTALTEFDKLKDNPDFAKVIPFYISQIYYKQGKYADVVNYTVPLIEKVDAKEQPELAKIIGDSYFHLQQFDKAIVYLKFFFETGDRKGREENYMLGYCYYLDREETKAIPHFENASKGNDKLAQNAYYHLADCYVATGDKNKARAAFEAASNMDFDDKIKEDALFNFAKITYELSYSPFNETIKAFDKYISLYPDSERNDAAYDYLVQVYMNTNNYGDAIASIEKIKVKSPSIKKAYQRVTFYRALENFNNLNYEAAIGFFDKSVENGQYNRDLEARANFWKAEAFYRLGHYSKAIDGFNRFLRSPGAISLPEYQTAHYNMGYAFFKQKDYTGALSWFRKYATQNEHNQSDKLADAYNRLGDCYFVERDYSMAIACFDKSYQMKLYDPDYALFQKAFCLGIQRENEQKISNLRTLLQVFPKSQYFDDALYELGRAYELTQPLVATGYYQDLAKEYPQSNFAPKALLQLGLIHYNGNEFKKSVSFYKQVTGQYPNSAEAQAALLGIKNNYVEMNDVDAYFEYAEKLGTGIRISASEQDSLTYMAAEKLFMAGDKKARPQFENYLQKFPQGSFVLHSTFYLAESQYNDGEFSAALPNYEYVISQPDNGFTEQALAKASELTFNAGNFARALDIYERLERASTTKWNLLKARAGLMRCLFAMNDYRNTIDAAKILLGSENVTDEMKREANHKLAVSYVQTEKYEQALPVLEKLATDVKSQEGAEAKYLIAEIHFRNKKPAQSEKEIMDFISTNTPHQYWLAKSFILLADIYLQNNDEFQAKHTLKSIIENYPEKEDGILKIAGEKLFRIEEKERHQQQQGNKGMEININNSANKK